MKVYLYPRFSGVDEGDGGVRRVVEAQQRHLPAYGIELVDRPEQADLINCHIMLTSDLERFLKTRPDMPLAVSSHGLYWQEYEWPEWALKANAGCMEAIRQADAITAPTEWVAQSIRRNSLRNVTVIGHGVELSEWPAANLKHHGGFVLWNKSRPDPVCDPGAVVQLAKLAPDVPFMTTFTVEPGLANVNVTGRMSYEESKELVREASVYLCTTRETFGIGTLEAMSAGVPVLGWRWGGQVEIIEHKVTGWLSRPGDYDDLLAGLRWCLENGEAAGKAARAAVKERYRWKDVVKQYAELYERVIEQADSRKVRKWTVDQTNAHPLVSVIVPAYGLEEHLPEALESVLNQTFEEWECIVVDDASPDRCGQIADEYAAQYKRIRVIHNETNKYLAGALNIGMAAARGRYLIALDADNVLPRTTLEILSNALETDRSLHIAYGNVEFLEPDGKRWHSGWPMAFRADWQLHQRNMVPSTAMIRREVWELTGGYRRRFRTAEDADFWTRATSYGFRAKMVTEADTLVYRNREGSMSRVEEKPEWTLWYPWASDSAPPPAAVISDHQVPVPSCDPPQISVVIPVGPGHEEIVIDAIDSVDAQTFRHWECIVVNDSGEQLRYVPSWVRYFETEGKIGVAAARNRGIRASRARHFLPLDADDILEPEALMQMFDVMKKYSGYVYSDWYSVRIGQEPTVWQAPDYDANQLVRNITPTGPQTKDGKAGSLHAVTALYPKSAWRDVRGFDEALPAWEDWDFQLKLANIGVCGTRIPAPLFMYRMDLGMRREANMAEFQEGKQAGVKSAPQVAMEDRWGEYFAGRKELMGCRSCGGGGGKKIDPQTMALNAASRIGAAPLPDVQDYVVVEYIGESFGARTFRGQSGQSYRFSAAATEKQKYVRRDDVDVFARRADFRVRQAQAPQEVGA